MSQLRVFLSFFAIFCPCSEVDPDDEAHDDAVHLQDIRGSVPDARQKLASGTRVRKANLDVVNAKDPMIPFDMEDSNKRMYLHLRRKERPGRTAAVSIRNFRAAAPEESMEEVVQWATGLQLHLWVKIKPPGIGPQEVGP